MRIPATSTLHGDLREDDYAWLRDKGDPRVAEYLNAENTYVDAALNHTKPLQVELYNEILSHIEQTDEEAPYPYRGYLYYTRTQEGMQYPIYCRKLRSIEAAEEVTLDLNKMAVGVDFLSIGAYDISDDGDLVAFSTDTTGFREYTLQFKNLKSGELLPDRIEKTVAVAWASDNRSVFYTVEDHAKRAYRVYRHTLGSATDVLIYEETDEMFRIHVNRSRSSEYLFITSQSLTATEVRYITASSPDADWKLVCRRSKMHEYYLDHHADSFYILTNSTGINFRIVTAPVQNPAIETWVEIVPHRPDVMLESALCFRSHLALHEREDGLPHIRIFSLTDDNQSSFRIGFPEPAYTVSPTANHEFDTDTIRYGYQSMVTPPSTFDFDMKQRTAKLVKQTRVPGGFDSNNYEARRVFATAPDDARVPISLVRRKGVVQDGSAPLFLYGYGSYGLSMPAGFSSSILALLDRGFVYAIAHIRGGGELGKAWHDSGRMFNKKNTFSDFIASAEMLVTEGYADASKVVISGGSAGGLLMGAVVNMRPDLFRAVISKVPFVDVINTMLDETLPLTVGEFEEWGNPKVKKEYDYIKSYCPYTNLEELSYPAMLVKTSFNDSQVMYWEPAKYVARLRTLKTDSHPLLLKTNMAGGHGGSSGRYDRIHEIALDYAFILDQLGNTLIPRPLLP
jgi:oligopeptidase B